MPKSESERLRAAFAAELADNPNRPPGPSALTARMGMRRQRNINGRMTALRTALLIEAGFTKDETKNRWTR